MTDPAYVSIASEYARRIRSGELHPRMQLPSYTDIARQYDVSDIVVRKAVELLQRQGLVRSVRRKGIFVTDRPSLIRVSPERQLEDPEATFQGESDAPIAVARDVYFVAATEDLAEAFGVPLGSELRHTVTSVAEGQRHVSVSDTFQLKDVDGLEDAVILEETVADRVPTPLHAEWLGTVPGDLVKQVHQRFIAADGRLVMLSDVSYPRDRYDGFKFRMNLAGD